MIIYCTPFRRGCKMKICDATIRINDGGGTAPHLAGPPKEGARPLRLAGLATSPVGRGSYYAVTSRSLPRMTGEGDRLRWWGHTDSCIHTDSIDI